MSTRHTTKTVAIVGGGASGALTAYHLVRQNMPARIIVLDPRPNIGLGLAYSTPSLRHLLNVPAGKISALPDEPGHFLAWLRKNYDPAASAETFAPRAVFGRYLQSIFTEARGVELLQASVVNYRRLRSGGILVLDNGTEVYADRVVMATGNFDPAILPGVTEAATRTGAYHHNAWTPAAYEGLAPDAPVTLIGTGLTAVDVVLRLRELGHRGVVTAVSRHGIFPNRHAPYTPIASSVIPKDTPATCVAYVKALHSAIRGGIEWRAAIDSLRAWTNDLWLALPLKEQQRFRRHLQRRWDVVRHRMAPPIADLIDAELQAETLVIREGHFAGVDTDGTTHRLSIQTPQGTQTLETTRVINCTGPSMNYRRVASPLLKSLFSQGLATAGPLGAGFRCAPNGAMIDAHGRPSETLFNLGPGRLGTLLESIAIPEIRNQAVELAEELRIGLFPAAQEETRGAYTAMVAEPAVA